MDRKVRARGWVSSLLAEHGPLDRRGRRGTHGRGLMTCVRQTTIQRQYATFEEKTTDRQGGRRKGIPSWCQGGSEQEGASSDLTTQNALSPLPPIPSQLKASKDSRSRSGSRRSDRAFDSDHLCSLGQVDKVVGEGRWSSRNWPFRRSGRESSRVGFPNLGRRSCHCFSLLSSFLSSFVGGRGEGVSKGWVGSERTGNGPPFAQHQTTRQPLDRTCRVFMIFDKIISSRKADRQI